MSAATFVLALPALSAHAYQPPSPVVRRGLLVGGCVAAAGLAIWAADPNASLRVDAELAFLLRGMAAIKTTLVLAAMAVLWWRLAHAVSQRTFASYAVGACLISGATASIWQISSVPQAALIFHAGELLLLFTAWGDHRLQTVGRVTTSRR